MYRGERYIMFPELLKIVLTLNHGIELGKNVHLERNSEILWMVFDFIDKTRFEFECKLISTQIVIEIKLTFHLVDPIENILQRPPLLDNNPLRRQ